MESSELKSIVSVADFYANQEILLTGATGFLGKSILEKLLFSCSGVKRIYCLMRSKSGTEVSDRLEKLKKDVVFDRVRKTNPDLLDKLTAIKGDVRDIGLSLSDDDFEKIKTVSIVIHSAATVRFDEPLKESILMNTRGTREVLILAKKLKNLKVFTHISTAYSNTEFKLCEEKIYPLNVDWRDSIKLMENGDTDTIDILTKHYIENQPNTYTFSKRLSEQMVNEFSKEMPIVIYRPAVVSPSHSEPEPGWADNFNGPLGVMLPVAIGISRILLADSQAKVCFVPVDFVTNSILTTTFMSGLELNGNPQKSDEVKVFNYGIRLKHLANTKDLKYVSMKAVAEAPLENMVWYPTSIGYTTSTILFRLAFIFLHFLPILFLDVLLKLSNRKIRLVKILRKILYAQISLHFFMTNDFDFKNHNTFSVQKIMSKSDCETFKFDNAVNYDTYIRAGYLGCRLHLMKETPETVSRARIKLHILRIVHYMVVAAMAYYLCYRPLLNFLV